MGFSVLDGLEMIEIEEEAGRGAAGVVYRARDRRTGETVALKVFDPGRGSAADRELQRQRWRREAELLQRLSHPNIVAVRGWVLEEESASLVTEFVEGGSLEDRLEECGVLPVEQALTIVSQAARALSHAHERGIVHRDVKPANLLLAEDGTVKLTDFGVAAALPEGSAAVLEGTPAYMAPEQLSGGAADARSDVYALGVVLYRSLTGRFPFRASTVRELAHRTRHEEPVPPSRWRAEVTPALEAACLKALARRPEDRFETGLSFARCLEEIAVPPGSPSGGIRPPRRTLRERALERTWTPERAAAASGPWLSSAIVLALAVLVVSWYSRPAVRPPLDRRTDGASVTVPAGFPPAPAVPVDGTNAPREAPQIARREPEKSPAPPTEEPAFVPPARPQPEEATWRIDEPRPLPEARAEIEVHHRLTDGVLEIRVDDARILRKVLAPPRPGSEAVGRARFEIAPGVRRLAVRVTSKAGQVDTESLWLGEWAEHGTRRMRYTLAREGEIWRLAEVP